MKLTIKPHNRNEYPIGGVLIKSPSPKVWLQEMQAMNLSLSNCTAYAVPSAKANVLYGCLIVTNIRVDSVGKNSLLQLIDDALFIPEYATIWPQIAPEEWANLFNGFRFVFLPEMGLFELKEAIIWSDLISGMSKVNVKITTPSKSVFIPNVIQTVRYELSEEDLLQSMENPLSEEEIIENLPFNMKKLLNGNQREMEKYLAYIEKNPEMALKLGIPLDTLGTSRGNNLGEFNFGGGFLGNWFGNWGSSSSSGMRSWISSKYWVGFMIFFFIVALIYSISSNSPDSLPTNSSSPIQTNSTEVQHSVSQSMAILVAFIIIMGFLLLKLLFSSSLSISKEYNFKSTVFLLIILLIALLVLLYPMYVNEGFDNKLSVLILIFVGILLYRVFNSNTTILKRDE